MGYYKYGKEEVDYLKEKDPILGKQMDRIGMIKRETDSNIFSSLISSIISQQISTKAASTIEKRLMDLVGSLTPGNLHNIEIESIQKCGMTIRKASYIKDIAEAAVNNKVDFNNLYKLPDEEAIKELVKLKGVGEWTAEMLLIHCIERPNILSYKDLAIRRGIMKLYGLDELSKKDFEKYRLRYSPYCTVASIYLWKISSEV